MRNWLVPRDKVRRSSSPEAPEQYFLDIDVGRQNTPPAAGDRVLFFKRQQSNVLFVSHAEFQPRASRTAIGALDAGLLLVSEPVPLVESHDLDYFLFSLTFIRDYEEPAKYFRGDLRTIPPHDFDTIVRGTVFLSRDTFYTLYQALPPRLRAAFHTYLVSEGWVEEENQKIPFYSRARYLLEFLSEEVVPVLEQLHHAASAFNAIDCEQKPVFESLVAYESQGEHQPRRLYDFGQYSSVAEELVQWGAEFGGHQMGIRDALALLTEERRQDDSYEDLRWTDPH